MNYLKRIGGNNADISEDKGRDTKASDYIQQLKRLNNILNEKDEHISSIQEDYKKIFNLFSDSVVLLDNQGYIIDLNKKAQFLLNKHTTDGKLIGRNWKDIVELLNCNGEKSIERELIENEQSYEKTKEIYVDKLERHFLVSVVPVRKQSEQDYFILVIKDVTNIKNRELNLIKKQKLLEYINLLTDIFNRNLNINYIMDKIAETMGNVENVDIVYIYRNCGCETYAKKIREYRKSMNDYELLEEIYYKDVPRGMEYFRLNHIVCGEIDKFPKHEQMYINKNGLKSICVVPIFTPVGFWGFIGFDSYTIKKQGTYDEEQLLKIAANIIGGEIYKWSLRNINNEVEDISVKCVNN